MKLNKYYINKRYRNKYAKDDDDYDYTTIASTAEIPEIIENTETDEEQKKRTIEAFKSAERTKEVLENNINTMSKQYKFALSIYNDYIDDKNERDTLENESKKLENDIKTNPSDKKLQLQLNTINEKFEEMKKSSNEKFTQVIDTMMTQTVLLQDAAKRKIVFNEESKYSLYMIDKTVEELQEAVINTLKEWGIIYDPNIPIEQQSINIIIPKDNIYETFATDMQKSLNDIDNELKKYIESMVKEIEQLQKTRDELKKDIENKREHKGYKTRIEDLKKDIQKMNESGRLKPEDIKQISDRLDNIRASITNDTQNLGFDFKNKYMQYVEYIKKTRKTMKKIEMKKIVKEKEYEKAHREYAQALHNNMLNAYINSSKERAELDEKLTIVQNDLNKKIDELKEATTQSLEDRKTLEKLNKEKEDINKLKTQLESKEKKIRELNDHQKQLAATVLQKGEDVQNASKQVNELQKTNNELALAKKERDDLIKIIDATYIKDDQKAKIIYDVLEKDILNLESIIYSAFAHYRDDFSKNGYDTHPFKEYMGFLLNEKNNYGFLNNKTEITDRYYYMAFSKYKEIFDKNKISLVREKEKYINDSLFSIPLEKEDKTVERGLGMWFYALYTDNKILLETAQITGGDDNKYPKFSYKGLFMNIYKSIGTDTLKKKALENISKYVYDNMGNVEGPEYTLYKASYAEKLKKQIQQKEEIKGEGFYGGKKKKKLTKQDIKRIANKIYNKKRGGDLIKAFQNIGNQEMPRSCREFLEQYGDREILSIQIGRRPVQGFIAPILDLLSSGEFSRRKNDLNIDSMFHVWTNPIIDDNGRMRTVTVEKNQTLNIGWNQYDQTEDYYTVSPATYPLTLNEYVENGLNYLRSKGLNPFNYDGAYNNCQKFVEALMVSNNLDYPDIRQFILQNTEYIVGQLDKHTQAIMKGAIDSAQFWNILVNGAGLRKRRPKIYD